MDKGQIRHKVEAFFDTWGGLVIIAFVGLALVIYMALCSTYSESWQDAQWQRGVQEVGVDDTNEIIRANIDECTKRIKYFELKRTESQAILDVREDQ